MTLNELSSARKQFEYYESLGQKAIAQCSDECLFDESRNRINNISIIVKHLNGNMLSRWTDFLQTDGEKTWRDREGEFDNNIKTRTELEQKWAEGWKCLYTALDSISEKDLDTVIYIRNMGHTIWEAINRQVCHYSYHIGQIVYIAKECQQDDWHPLSIPHGESKAYNAGKFAQEKRIEHFTKEFLGDEEK